MKNESNSSKIERMAEAVQLLLRTRAPELRIPLNPYTEQLIKPSKNYQNTNKSWHY